MEVEEDGNEEKEDEMKEEVEKETRNWWQPCGGRGEYGREKGWWDDEIKSERDGMSLKKEQDDQLEEEEDKEKEEEYF